MPTSIWSDAIQAVFAQARSARTKRVQIDYGIQDSLQIGPRFAPEIATHGNTNFEK